MIDRIRRRVTEGGNYFAAPAADVQFISSGGKTLDLALGGGWAEDHVINIVGDKSTGKTLLAIEACANFVRKYPKSKPRYRETEHAFQQGYARALGMPVEQVDFGREPLQTIEDLYHDLNTISAKAKGPELVIIDSLDALSDAAELEREFGKGSYGGQKAKDMSKLFRMLAGDMSKHVTLMIISQVRDNIDAFSFGRDWKRSGGRALDFYAAQVVYLAHRGAVKRTINGVERPVGVKIKAKVDKNKVGLPLREADFNIQFGYGIDDVLSCLEWLASVGSLAEFGDVPKNKIVSYSRQLMRVDNVEYNKTVERLHKIVERRWGEIETSFLPKRQKYGE